MSHIWLKTLKALKELHFGEERPFFWLNNVDEKAEGNHVVPITESEQIRIDEILNKLSYPNCPACKKPVCGSLNALCHCRQYQVYRDEFVAIHQEIAKAKIAIDKLSDTPFRQSRNAYGFSSSTVSGMNLLLGTVLLTKALALSLLIVYSDRNERLFQYEVEH